VTIAGIVRSAGFWSLFVMFTTPPLFGYLATTQHALYFVERALDAAVFVAHNARFDWRFLAAECVAVGAPAPGGKPLCTVRLTRRLVPELRHRGLDHVAAFFGVDNPARHRAFGDALATARVLRALLERARERGVETLEQLVELHDRPRHKHDKVRNAECGMRSIEGSVDRRTTSHCNSALRTPHSALPE